MSSFFDEIAAKLAQLSGVATPEVSRDELNEFNVRDIQAVRVSEGGGGGGGNVPFVGVDPPGSPTDGMLWWDPDDDTPASGSQFWDEHDLSGGVADWTSDANGTWTNPVAGQLSQTNDTADSYLQYNTAVPSTEFVMEAEVRVPSGQDSGTTVQAVIAAGNSDQIAQSSTGISSLVGEGASLFADTTGDGADYAVQAWVDGQGIQYNFSNSFPVTMAQDEWHTLRVVASPARQLIYWDGDYIFENETISGGNAADGSIPSSIDNVMLGAVGLVDFRNVKVWTRPVPT